MASTTPRPLLSCALAALAILLASSPPATAAPTLTQPASKRGCVAAGGRGCVIAPAVHGTSSVTVTRDGRFVYAVSRGRDALLFFRRNRDHGGLTPLGCLSRRARFGCRKGVAIDEPSSVTISPDGRHVYVAAGRSHAVTSYRRHSNGKLSRIGCLATRASPSCSAAGAALENPDAVEATAEGGAVVLTAGGAVTLLARDKTSGRLMLSTCLTKTGRPRCPGGDLLVADTPAQPVATSPDGRFIYVSGQSALTIVGREPATGALHRAGCVTTEVTPGCTTNEKISDDDIGFPLIVSPDGRHLYENDFTTGTGVSLVTFSRDTITGALRETSCLAEAADPAPGCSRGRVTADDPYRFSVTPDGRALVATVGTNDTISIMRRDRSSGRLSVVRGRTGCISENGTSVNRFNQPPGTAGRVCRDGRRMVFPTEIAISRDNRNVYVATNSGIIVLTLRT